MTTASRSSSKTSRMLFSQLVSTLSTPFSCSKMPRYASDEAGHKQSVTSYFRFVKGEPTRRGYISGTSNGVESPSYSSFSKPKIAADDNSLMLSHRRIVQYRVRGTSQRQGIVTAKLHCIHRRVHPMHTDVANVLRSGWE